MSSLVQIQTKSGRQYWRSLEELAHNSEFRAWAEQEFPNGIPETAEGASRRTLLKVMAASFGLAGLTACSRPVEHVMPMSKGIEDYVHGKPLYYASALTLNGVASGVLVKCVDGRPIKVEGNPKHPDSLGATSAFHQAAVLGLYDPDRAKYPHHNGARVDWAEFEKFAAELQGDGLRILSERSSSPTLAAVKAQLLKRFPQAQWIEYDSITNDASREGTALAFGEPLDVVPHYDQADVILSLDCDFLGLDSPTILPTKQFSAKRRVSDPKDTSNRLYVVEANYSITGAMADHRIRMRLGDIAATFSDSPALRAAFEDLRAHKGRALILAGPRMPAAVHARVASLNSVLEAPVSYYKPALNVVEQTTSLRVFAADLAAKSVKTLIVLGGNPAYTLPADIDIRNVPNIVALTVDENETWRLAAWQLPETHSMEAWSDARALDGTATIMQPQIEPLYEGRSVLEVAALLATGSRAKSYDLVRNHWTSQWPALEAEKKWRKSVHDGFVEGTTSAPVKPQIKKDANLPPSAPAGYEVAFYPSASVYDGRFANNAWLQETPEPLTKVVWDNAALLSPATAKHLEVQNGDLLEFSAGGVRIEVPAMIMPGHAEDSFSLALGYGRSACGRVGQGVGHNVGPLRRMENLSILNGVQVKKTGRTYELVTTQEYHTMVEPITNRPRTVVRESTLEHYREQPEHVFGTHTEELFSMYPEYDYSHGYQWGMAIDLNACTGCNACMLACIAENNIPVVGKDQVRRGREMHWIRMDRYFTGDENEAQVVWMPMACQQCENAPCESVCPVAATAHSPEGLNEMAYNRCVGTRYCSNNCPYKVRRFNFLNWHLNIEETTKMVHNPDVTVRMRGVMEKCSYCIQRIQNARITAKADNRRQLKDGDVISACQQVCPAEAIVFGNLLDPESKVARMKKQPRNYTVLEDLNTRPRTTYLAKLRNPNPGVDAAHG